MIIGTFALRQNGVFRNNGYKSFPQANIRLSVVESIEQGHDGARDFNCV